MFGSPSSSAPMRNLADSGRALLGQPPRERAWHEQFEEEVCKCCPTLSYKQRLAGCVVCVAIGMVLEFGSIVRLLEALGGDPSPFAIFYTIGNVIALCGTFFLNGPASQLKKMCDKTRRVTCFVFLLAMALTLFCAFAEWVRALARSLLVRPRVRRRGDRRALARASAVRE
jgi:hypothetical protein